MTDWPKRKVIGTRQIQRDVRRARRVFRGVDLEPHRHDECPGGHPCPYVSCRYHLWADVTKHGSLMVCHPDKEPWELEETCALDVAESGVTALEDIAWYLGITRERVRQILDSAFAKIEGTAKKELGWAYQEYLDGERKGGYVETRKLSGFILRGERKLGPSPQQHPIAPNEPEHGVIVVMIPQHPETFILTPEHIRRRMRCTVMASRLYDLLLLRPEAHAEGGLRRSLKSLTRLFVRETGNTVSKGKVKRALTALEKSGLVKIGWEVRGAVRRLSSVSIVISIDSDHRGPNGSPLEEAA